MAQASETSIVDQGEAGNDLAQLLRDALIDAPHAGDSWSDYERGSKARMFAHELRSANVDSVSGVRDLAVGRRFKLTGHPEVNTYPLEERDRSTVIVQIPDEGVAMLSRGRICYCAYAGNHGHSDRIHRNQRRRQVPTAYSGREAPDGRRDVIQWTFVA